MRRRRDRGGQRHNRRGEGDGKEKEWKEEKPSGRHEERGSRGSEKRTKQARDSDQRRVISLRWHIRGAQDRRYDVSAFPPRSLPPLPSAWLLTAKSVYSYRSTPYNITSWISPLCSAFVAFQHWQICTVFILLIKSWYVHETATHHFVCQQDFFFKNKRKPLAFKSKWSFQSFWKKTGWKTNFQHVDFHLYLTTNECILKNVLNQLLFSRYFRNDEYSIVTEIALKTDL